MKKQNEFGKKKLKVIVIQLVIWSKKSVRKEKEKYPDPRTSVLSSSSSISKKMKSLHEGYTKYNFCVVELKNFEEASKEKEIEMIENNKTLVYWLISQKTKKW